MVKIAQLKKIGRKLESDRVIDKVRYDMTVLIMTRVSYVPMDISMEVMD